MKNFRERQTYFGAIEQRTGDITCEAARAGDGLATVDFVEKLRQKYDGKRLLLVWDGASYHTGEEMCSYLQQVNQGQDSAHWPVTCILFAPHAPEQNPMEDVWLKGKQFVRKHWWKCSSFRQVKETFLQALTKARYTFDKLFTYAPFLAVN